MNKYEDLNEINTILNKKSGLFGLAEIGSGDMRDIVEAGNNGNTQAKLALDVFVRRLVKYIGSYVFVLGGVDAIIFTGGIGENSSIIREKVIEKIEKVLPTKLDREANNKAFGIPCVISTEDSRVKMVVMPTNEEFMIANQTLEVINK